MKIYTKLGDGGKTKLADGTSVSKSDAVIEAYGTVDELNAWMGILKVHLPKQNEIQNLKKKLFVIQEELFIIGAYLSTPVTSVSAKKLPKTFSIQTILMEKWIDEMQDRLSPLHNFVLPGADVFEAYCQIARTVCRRAERQTVKLIDEPSLSKRKEILIYLNRLSDFLFVLGRYSLLFSDKKEEYWKGHSI